MYSNGANDWVEDHHRLDPRAAFAVISRFEVLLFGLCESCCKMFAFRFSDVLSCAILPGLLLSWQLDIMPVCSAIFYCHIGPWSDPNKGFISMLETSSVRGSEVDLMLYLAPAPFASLALAGGR